MHTIRFEPVGKAVTYDEPVIILEAAREAGVEILALCGGLGSCGRCRVKVRGAALPPSSETEKDVLSREEIAAGYRLACRTLAKGDVIVYIPEMSRPRAQKLQVAGREEPVACCPYVHKFPLKLVGPTLEDTRSDLERIGNGLRDRYGVDLESVDLAVLPTIGPLLRQEDWEVTVSLRGSELIAIEPGDAAGRTPGIAVDLGSTKIAVYLVDLRTGETIEARGVPNPQIAYGEDIITRINYAIDHGDGTVHLQQAVIEVLNETIRSLCEDSDHGLSQSHILEITVVGNTAMHHFLLGLPTEQLARSPCVPILAHPLQVKARELGLHAAPGATVYFPPPVAGFVGSDHVAMVLASRLDEKNGTYLGIDIGTNTEISLKRGDEIWAVSCASGPAFEGAAICWGMKAAPGSIERVWIDPRSQDVHFSTIEDEPPVGICGSGILDCVAGMLGARMLNTRGLIQPDARGVRIGEDGLPELVVAEAANGQMIAVTQRDVERIQLAKGAIRSGIEVLMHAASITPSEVDEVILAGAFGTTIDPLSAVQIGMLPPIDPDRIVQVGNAAGIGAKEMLISSEQRLRAERIAAGIKYLELTVYPRYSRFFAHALRF
jgi:uncharacterized 2Fe-2S/4Fe-4S cluster protein (DUF4445 family)